VRIRGAIGDDRADAFLRPPYVMRRTHIAGVCIWIALTSAAATAQQNGVEQHDSTQMVLDINGRWLPLERTVTRRSVSNGQEQVVVDIYRPNPALPGEGMPLSQRIVTTVRAVGPDRWVTERTTYEYDINGRLTPSFTEREESTRLVTAK
jgi:hypothetical protein